MSPSQELPEGCGDAVHARWRIRCLLTSPASFLCWAAESGEARVRTTGRLLTLASPFRRAPSCSKPQNKTGRGGKPKKEKCGQG